MLIKRRDFLKMGSMASASLMFPRFLKAFDQNSFLQSNGKKLVVLQLSGGNDGLNTIIPMRNDIYFKVRETIAIQNALPLSDESGIHPALVTFKELYDQGELAILNNVGYPDPDKSHFRSMDIWQSASKSNEFLNTGWIGRYLDYVCEQCPHPTQALEIESMLSLALKGNNNKALAFTDPIRLWQTAQEDYFKTLYKVHTHGEETVDYLYKILGDTINNAGYIYENIKVHPSDTNYPDTQIGKDLQIIASLIKSDINTTVYYLTIGSFDTHINQLERQQQLFIQISDAVKSFVSDLKSNQLFDDTLLMTFSEFGRRVAQNASKGTDHGTANQMFFISGGLKKKGLINALPDLENLNDGDLIFTEDFRKVYATVLKNWLNTDQQTILNWQNGMYDFV
jgi:uncharacterized protein (DUF1501 family)